MDSNTYPLAPSRFAGRIFNVLAAAVVIAIGLAVVPELGLPRKNGHQFRRL